MTITPESAKQLMDKFDVHVERSPTRIIKDQEYEKVRIAARQRVGYCAQFATS